MLNPSVEPWPPAIGPMEEIVFAAFLRVQTTQEERAYVIRSEREFRLQNPDRALWPRSCVEFVVVDPSKISDAQQQNDLTAQSLRLDHGLPKIAVSAAETPVLQQSDRDGSLECAAEDHSQSEFATLERLFPTFWRALLEGRLAHLLRAEQFGQRQDMIG